MQRLSEKLKIKIKNFQESRVSDAEISREFEKQKRELYHNKILEEDPDLKELRDFEKISEESEEFERLKSDLIHGNIYFPILKCLKIVHGAKHRYIESYVIKKLPLIIEYWENKLYEKENNAENIQKRLERYEEVITKNKCVGELERLMMFRPEEKEGFITFEREYHRRGKVVVRRYTLTNRGQKLIEKIEKGY